MPGLREGDRPVVSDLKAIEARPATITAADISMTVVDLPGGSKGVRLRTTAASTPPGLYVGSLVPAPGASTTIPVQLYVSGASDQ